MLIRIQKGELSFESGMAVAQYHKPVHLLHHRTLKRFLDFLQRIVMPVYVPGLPRLTEIVKIIPAGKQSHIIYLGDSGREKLHRSRH